MKISSTRDAAPLQGAPAAQALEARQGSAPRTPRRRRTAPTAGDYQEQALAVLRRSGRQPDGSAWVARELAVLRETGDTLCQERNYGGAAAVYQGLIAAILQTCEERLDQEGDLLYLVQECVSGLGQSLSHARDRELRGGLLESLFSVYRTDIRLGGIGLGEEVPDLIVAHATAAERQAVGAWVRQELPGCEPWGRHEYGAFLLALEEERLDDESFLRLCQETGRTADAVELLLLRGRLAEAEALASGAEDYDLICLADLFVRHQHGPVAERLLLGRARHTRDARVLAWLQRYYLERHDLDSALQAAERGFALRPSLAGYEEVRKLGRRLNCWDALRPRLLAVLDDPRCRELRIEIDLADGDIDHAVDAVRRLRQPSSWYRCGLKVAAAAERTRPQAAVELYCQRAERLITQRGRDNYRAACGLFKKARDLLVRGGQEVIWVRYVSRVRERHRLLRALQEELNAAGM